MAQCLNSLTVLPSELLELVFIFLGDYVDKIRTVSKFWFEMTLSPHLWMKIHEFVFGSEVQTHDWEQLVKDNYRTIQPMSVRLQTIWSIKTRNISYLRSLLMRSASLQFHLHNPNQNSALYLACIHGDTPIVKLLLAHGCHPNDFNVNESSPLYVAAQEGHLEACKLLISNGADFNFTFREGYTPLYIAAQRGRLDIVKYLAEDIGANPFVRCRFGSSPLYIAAQEGHREVVEYLLKKGADSEVCGSIRFPINNPASLSSRIHAIIRCV